MLGVRSLGTDLAEQDPGEHKQLANLLASTRKKENVVGGHAHRNQMAMSGKSGMKGSVSFKTPYNASKSENTFKHAQTSVKPSRPILQTRVLGDKTPLPNRQLYSTFTPLPRSASKKAAGKTPLPSLLDVVKGSTPVQPPSTGRKKSRTPSSVNRMYETPITKGDHWNVSDVSIDIGGSSLEEVHEEDIEAEDFSDVEYAPPTATVPPYEPPFDLPNFKELGERLFRAAHSYPVNEPPIYDEEFDADELLKDSGWSPSGESGLQLAELEEHDPYLMTLQSIQPSRNETKPAIAGMHSRTTTTRPSGLPVPSLATRSSLYSHTKSNSVPHPIRKPPSRATSNSTLQQVQTRPATVAATRTAARPMRATTAGARGAVSASASVARSIGTLSTRSSVPNLSSIAQKTVLSTAQTKVKPAGLTVAGTRETKASLTRAMVRIRHIGGDVAAEASKALEKEKAKAGGIGARKIGTSQVVANRVKSGTRSGLGGGPASAKVEEEDLLEQKFDDLSIDGDAREDFRFQL